MRCPQCGFEAVTGAAFCSRCGTRMMMPHPETRHEYALTRVLPSWWHFSRELGIAVVLIAAGIYSLAAPQGHPKAGALLIAAAAVVLAMVSITRRYTSWSLTSDR